MKEHAAKILITVALLLISSTLANISIGKARETVFAPSTTPTPSASPAPRTPPLVEWSKTYGLGSVRCVIQTADGGYAVADSTFLKTDSAGNVQWNITLDDGIITASIVQTDDGYALAGAITDGFILMRTDALGNMVWNKTYTGIYGDAETSDDLSNVFATSDGGYVLAGTLSAWTGASLPDYTRFLKTDSNGNEVWTQDYEGLTVLAATQTSDGGYAFITVSADGMLLAKLDASGRMEWNQTYPDAPFVNALVQASDGGYAIVATVGSSSDTGFWLAKTDWLGNMQWNRTYVGPGNGTNNWSFTRTSDGGYALIGATPLDSSAPHFSGVRVWVLKTDMDGNSQWNQTYGGPNGTEGRAIIQTNDDGYIIAGGTTELFETSWPDFMYVAKLAYSPRTSASGTALYVATAAVVAFIAVVAVAVVLRRRKSQT